MNCYIFVKFLLTTALLRKLGACRPCTPRRTFGRPAVLYYFFLRQESLPLTWCIHHVDGGVGYGKKIIPFAENRSTWSLLTLNHFSFSDYGLLRIPHLRMTLSPQVVRHALACKADQIPHGLSAPCCPPIQ